ncbi:hypothetical protein [Actinospica sp.]|jgi:hypothetical protein|uniref:hypothetical protein n=1 Tax=Actinospica sp. TaxID=1872142 RepID=UPI002BCA465F|nr:hypothetical protein [Actinospica sp.]HWG26519.1 hypothetical protein [Actinospica sp.]
MAKYLLALYSADAERRSPDQVEKLWADVNALGEKLTEAGAFVFQGGLIGAESATVVRRSGGEFLM